jgi:hypothetical protein
MDFRRDGADHPPRPNNGVHGRNFAKRLCRVLGLDDDQVRSITLNVSAEEAVTLDVRLMLHPEDADGVVELLSRYHLVAVPKANGQAPQEEEART